MRIVAYCRVSTDKEDQLNSLEAQKAFFEEYAVRNGHELVHMYVDEGITGTRIKNRKQFQQMMKDAELKMFDMLVCKDISRLGRNTIDVLDSVRKLKDLKIENILLGFQNRINFYSFDTEQTKSKMSLLVQNTPKMES